MYFACIFISHIYIIYIYHIVSVEQHAFMDFNKYLLN